MSIRKLIKSDVPFFNLVRNSSVQYLHDNTSYNLEESYSWFDKNNNPYFIYEFNNKPIGYFRTSNWNTNTCYVGMDIHPDYRGKGLSTQAYLEFFVYLQKNYNIDIFRLEVLKSNTRALNLYIKLGFVIIGSYIDKLNRISYKMELYENQ